MLIAALVICVIVVGALVVLTLRLERGAEGERAEMERRFYDLGEALGATDVGPTFPIDVDGRAFVLELKQGRAGKLALSIETAVERESQAGASTSIVVRRETKLDRLGKALRINREVQTGDAAFDAAAYVESDAQDNDVARVLGAEEVRRHAYALLEQGFSSITIPVGSGRIVAVRDTGGIGLEPEAVRAACQDLGAAASLIPLPPTGGRPASVWLIGPATAAFCAVVLFLGLSLFTWSRSEHYPLAHGATTFGVGLGLLVWVVVLPIVGALVRGRSGSFRLFCACFCLLAAALPLTGAGLAVALNARWDGDAPTLHQARVQAKWSRSFKGSASYFVRLDGFSETDTPIVLPVDQEIYAAVAEGESVVVEVGPGRFGWSWLKGIRQKK